jgi:ubiquinone/menaquinone biosynthesis C-methylase UbiE
VKGAIMILRIILILFSIPATFLILHTIIRVIRALYKFPMPQWMANLIDNPLRRKIQPPNETATRHGIKAGMRVLEVGPGNGTYTLGAAKKVGPDGEIFAIDIEPRMISRLNRKIKAKNIGNIRAQVANVYALPFAPETFDLISMIAVINEIPDIPKALGEFWRVLKPDGKLVLSELLLDPDYPLARRLICKVETQRFRLAKRIGNFFYYTLIFKKLS